MVIKTYKKRNTTCLVVFSIVLYDAVGAQSACRPAFLSTLTMALASLDYKTE